jgi:K+-transporting ATPase A subunit
MPQFDSGAAEPIGRFSEGYCSGFYSGDGGGFFNANSAHPFENPTALTNLFEMLLIVLIGAALTNTFGRMVGNERQGWSLLGAMAVLFAVGLGVVYPAETSGNLHFATIGIDQSAGPLQRVAIWRARKSGSASPARRSSQM